jgi:hypothetical protein
VERALPAPQAPWSERLIDASRWSPVLMGTVTAAALVFTFLGFSLAVGRLPLVIAGDAALPVREDIRIGVVLALLVAYLPAAWTSATRRARRTLAELEPVLAGPHAGLAVQTAGRYRKGALRLAGLSGLAIGGGVQIFTDWGEESIQILGLPFETYWHRLMLGTIAWFAGRAVYGTIVESWRFSRMGRELVTVDLLDPSPVAALPRWGLHSALLVIGALSLCALLFYDFEAAPQLLFTLAATVLGTLALAGVGLLLPVRGLRDNLRGAKRRELAWCHDQIQRTREGGAKTSELSLADLISYRALIESVREWPLDVRTLSRFALYLVIPPASWLGGALVERLVDSLAG